MVGKQTLGPILPSGGDRHISPIRKKVLVMLNDKGKQGVTVTEAAAHLGGHPNRSRAHLDGLVADGLASSSTDRPNGRGRPTLRYWISPAGHTLLEGNVDADNQSLTRAFISYMASAGADSVVHEIGKVWAKSVPVANDAKASESVAQRLTTLLATAAFNPTIAPDEQTIWLRTCPFVNQAHADKQGICGVHQHLIEGALEAWDFQGESELNAFGQPGACSISISEDSAHSASATDQSPEPATRAKKAPLSEDYE